MREREGGGGRGGRGVSLGTWGTFVMEIFENCRTGTAGEEI